MSCIYLEITSGTAWGLMNSQTAGNSATVFSTELSAALCLSIGAFFPQPRHSSRHAQQGNRGLESVKAASLLPLFHLQTRGSQSDCRREKPSPSQHGCYFRATPICCMHPDFPHSHWAIQEITADTEPFVSLLCSPLVTSRQNKEEKNGSIAPRLPVPPPMKHWKLFL